MNLNDASKFDVVASSIKGMPGVADVQDQKKLLEKFFTFMNTVSWAAIALSSLMVLAAVMLISTTIRQTAFSRRRETGIMRLVGASNFTIRFPFVMETVLASVLGAVLAMGMLWATVRYGVVGFLSQTLTDTAFIGVADVYYVAPVRHRRRRRALDPHVVGHAAPLPAGMRANHAKPVRTLANTSDVWYQLGICGS